MPKLGNLLSALGGAFTALLGMATDLLKVSLAMPDALKAFVLGALGSAGGYLAKLALDRLRKWLTRRKQKK